MRWHHAVTAEAIDLAHDALAAQRSADNARLERVLAGIRDRRIRRLVGWEHALYRIRGDAWLLADLEIVRLWDPPLTFATQEDGRMTASVPRMRAYVTHRATALA